MALSAERSLQVDYDARGDVLYASVGEPQPALSFEIDTDILLQYVPPSSNVVGITIINFFKHFPQPDTVTTQTHATGIVEELLRKYPAVPVH